MNKLIAACTTGLLVLHPSAHGAWEFQPQVTAESGYDDNTRLNEQVEDDSIISSLEGRARLRNLTEASDVTLIVGGKFTHYSGIDLDDEHAEFVKLQASAERERSSFGIDGTFRRDELLRNTQFDPDFVDGPGVGLDPIDGLDDADVDGDIDVAIEEQISRNHASVRPYYLYKVSERTQANVSLDLAMVRYGDDAEQFGLHDNERAGVALNVTHLLSPTDAVGVNLRASRFEPDDIEDSETYEIAVGWEHQFTERSRVSIDVGGRQIERGGDSDTGALFRLTTERDTETGELFGFVERSVRPNGFGNVVEADRLGLGWEHGLSEQLSFLVNLNAVSTSDSNEGFNSRDRDYFEVRPELNWRLAESWSLGASYRFRWVDRERFEDEASSNSAFLFLSYHPPVPGY